MNLKDLVIHFYTKSFRGSLCQGRSITQAIRTRSEIEDLNLCRELHTSVLSTLLQSTLLQGEERIRTISEHSNMSYSLFFDSIVYTEKWGHSYIRGFGDKLESDSLNDKNNLLIGKSLYGASQEFQSINKLNDPNQGLTEKDLQIFFNTSEQVPSRIKIISDNWKDFGSSFEGVGLLIQLMPGVEEDYLRDVFKEISENGVLRQIAGSEVSEDGFKTLFGKIDEEVKYETKEFEYKCNCNKESMIYFIEKLDVSELVQIKNKNHFVSCSYCNEKYYILPSDVDLLIK